MKKVLSILLICIMVLSLASCGKQEPVDDRIKYDVKGISFYLPREIQVDTALEEGFVYNDGTEVIAIETIITDRAKFDALIDELKQRQDLTDVSKLEIAGMSTATFMRDGHPVFILFNFDSSISYAFSFPSYTFDDETTYMNIMNSISLSGSEE